MKLVTVVVPNYNCEEYLDKCLEHVVGQTYKNLEIIVCDNGSEDNSVAIIRKWAEKDNRIVVLINEENQGLINCYNRMFFAATGDYVAIQDADDWCDLMRVEKQVAVLESHAVGMCVTNSVYYSHLEPPSYPDFGPSGNITVHSEEVWAPATIMFRREILEVIPGYHKYFDRLTSYDRYFIMDIVDRFGGYYLNDHLYHVWARPNSDHRSIDLTEIRALKKMLSQDTFWELKRQRVQTGTDWLKDNNMAAVEAYENKMLKDNKYIADKIRAFACIQIDYGNYEQAWELLIASFKKAPFFIENYKSLLYYFRSRFGNKKNFKELTVQSAK